MERDDVAHRDSTTRCFYFILFYFILFYLFFKEKEPRWCGSSHVYWALCSYIQACWNSPSFFCMPHASSRRRIPSTQPEGWNTRGLVSCIFSGWSAGRIRGIIYVSANCCCCWTSEEIGRPPLDANQFIHGAAQSRVYNYSSQRSPLLWGGCSPVKAEGDGADI